MTAMMVEDQPDLDFAGLCASQVHDNWGDPAYRNGVTMALGIFIENMIWHHRHEWQDLVNRTADGVVSKGRRAVIKAYLATALEDIQKDDLKIRPYTRSDGTRVSGYDREWNRRNRGGQGGFARRTYLEDEGGLRLDRAAELGRAVNAYRTDAEGNKFQAVHYTIEDKHGNERDVVARNGRLPKLKHDERVTSFKPMGLDQPITLGGDTFNLLQALGTSPKSADFAGSLAEGIQQNAQVEGGHFAKVHDASQTFLKLAGGNAAPPAVQAAAAMGLYVGKHGPEVARVLGPHARRMTYKYRGMVATPTQQAQIVKNGKQPDETTEQYEHRLAYALASDSDEDGGLKAIPDETTNNLLLATGSTAPSHGFILDKTGKVTQQAVGVADDHYVPFNLAQLHTLSDGSYVRSRAYGGPTTEDLSLALRSGAKRATVISRHGAYTIEMDNADSARKRYGDVPVTVVNRYGRLLDAVRNAQESGVTDPETGEPVKLNGRGYEVALNALKTQFPLLIKDVKYYPPSEVPSLAGHKESAGAAGKEDTGYVRPFYLKPSEAVNGYYDELLGYDPEYGPTSYDDLDNYRVGKANVLRSAYDDRMVDMAAAAEAAAIKDKAEKADLARVKTLGSNPNPATAPAPGTNRTATPNNLTGQAAVNAEAGAGQRQESRILDKDDADALVQYVKHSLSFLNNVHDPELREIKDGYTAHMAGTDEGDKWLANLRSNPGDRHDLINTLDSHLPTDDDTGLKKVVIPYFPSAGPDNMVDPPTAAEAPSAVAGEPSVDQLKKDPLYPTYAKYKVMLQREKDPNLGDNGKKALAADHAAFNRNVEGPDSPTLREIMEDPAMAPFIFGKEDTEGLPVWQHFENKLLRAAHVDSGGDPNKYRPRHVAEVPPDDPGGPDYEQRMMNELRDKDY